MGINDNSQRRYRKRSYMRVVLPIIALILLALAAGIAFALVEPAYGFLAEQIEMPADDDGLRLAVGGGIFFAVLVIYAILYTFVLPKASQEPQIAEASLDKESQQRLKEQEASERRKETMREKMRQRNRK